jgi:hypothetical protein
MLKDIGSKSRALLIAATVGVGLGGPAIADQTHVDYSLAAGASSAAITVPIANSPVMMSCTQNVAGNVGEGQATIIRSATDVALDWVGFDFFTAAISAHFSTVNGTHIIWCDNGGFVDIEVVDATRVKVHNATPALQSGVIMFVY